MKNIPGNGDPSATAGNRRRRSGMVIASVAAVAAIAACSSSRDSGESAERPDQTTTTTVTDSSSTTSPEMLTESVRSRTQAMAGNYGMRILDEFNENKSEDNFQYVDQEGQTASVNVLYDAPTLLAGDHGEYGFAVNYGLDSEGNIDYSKLNSVVMFMNLNVSGNEVAQNPGDRVNFFSFSMERYPETDDWYVNVSEVTKGGPTQEMSYSTKPSGVPGDTVVPLTHDLLDDISGYVDAFMLRGFSEVPVNYPQVNFLQAA